MLVKETLQHLVCMIFEDNFFSIYTKVSLHRPKSMSNGLRKREMREIWSEQINEKKGMDLWQLNQKHL